MTFSRKTISEGRIILPKDIRSLTVYEAAFLMQYMNTVSAVFSNALTTRKTKRVKK